MAVAGAVQVWGRAFFLAPAHGQGGYRGGRGWIGQPEHSGRVGDRLPALVWVITALFVALELAVSARYGFPRDEMYFIAAGHHLAPGHTPSLLDHHLGRGLRTFPNTR